MPAYAPMLGWVALRGVGVWLQIKGVSSVSALAHLGGAAVGVAFWAFRRTDRESP